MISIITSLYRSEPYLYSFLEQAKEFESSLKKRDVMVEHIYIANEPNHSELSLLHAYNCNVEFVSREPLYASWNRGIAKSTGEFLTFWNVDDMRYANAVEGGITVLQEGYDAVYFPFIYKRYISLFKTKLLIKKKKVKPIDYDQNKFQFEMHAGPHFIVRRDVFEKIGAFDESYVIAGDFEWWARFARSGLLAKKVDFLSGVFTNDGHTLSGSKQTSHQAENLRVYNSGI